MSAFEDKEKGKKASETTYIDSRTMEKKNGCGDNFDLITNIINLSFQ